MRSDLIHEKTRVSCIGTGVMGGPMASHILRSGFPLTVYNRTAQKAKGLLDAGASWAASIQDAAKAASIIITMLGTPEDVESVYLESKGLLDSAPEGSILIDMTSSDPQLARLIHQKAQSKGIHVLDAPVTGGQRGAIEGRLTIFAAGDEGVFHRAEPVLRPLGVPRYMGEAGSGQFAKLANQIAIASTMLGVCEALVFIRKNNLDQTRVLEGMIHGSAASWVLQNLGPRMLKDDTCAGFYVKHFIKDLVMAHAQAKKLGMDCPGLEAALDRYQELKDLGCEDLGTQALYQLYCNPEALTKPLP